MENTIRKVLVPQFGDEMRVIPFCAKVASS